MKCTRPVMLQSLLPFLLFFSSFGALYGQAVPPDLVGVWITADNRNRIEIEADGKVTTWSYETRISRGVSAVLVLEEEERMIMLDGNIFELTSKGKKTSFRYEITGRSSADIRMSWIPLEAGLLEFKFSRLVFGIRQNDRDNGSYQMHRNLAVFAKLMQALKAQDITTFAQVLGSAGSRFLSDPASLNDKSTLAQFIRQRIWGEALSANSLAAVKLLISELGIEVQAIDAGRATDPELIAYLQNSTGIDNSALAAAEVQQLNFLLSQFLYLEQPLVLKRLFSRHGGMSGDDSQRNAATTGPFSDAEQEEDNRISLEARLNPGLWNKVVEEAFRICLQNFYQGKPIPKKILNAKTIPGKTFVKELTTPLYYYAVSTHARQQRLYTYNVMKVLLEFGADPTIRPSAKHAPLVEFMYANVEHQNFRDAIATSRKHPEWLKGRTARPGLLNIMAEIEAYNDVMKMIGGPPYSSEEGPAAERSAQTGAGERAANVPSANTGAAEATGGAMAVQRQPLPQYWHMRIIPAASGVKIDPGIVAFWDKGMYVFLQPDGYISFNTDAPGPYFTDGEKNKWQQEDSQLTIQLGDIPYTLPLPNHYQAPLSAVDSGPGTFKMLLAPRLEGEK